MRIVQGSARATNRVPRTPTVAVGVSTFIESGESFAVNPDRYCTMTLLSAATQPVALPVSSTADKV
jgi:hypothetical protein